MSEHSRQLRWQKGIIIAGAVAAAAYSAVYLHRLYYRNRRKLLLAEVHPNLQTFCVCTGILSHFYINYQVSPATERF